MTLFKNLPICCLFFLSCARVTSPTGGPKDSIPPIVIKTYPATQQTNFKEKRIELTFNELVILNNPKEQIIITPSIGKDFEVTAKKNKVTLTLENDLEDNTTYTVNLRESIQDITEKNAAKNLKLAFSTGDYIDSLTIEGRVFDLLKSTDFEDATVAIYSSDTFNIFQHKPSYITKTDKKGIFKIENLKPGIYYAYAFNDKNKNLIPDSKTEHFGFISQPIALTTNNSGTQIPLIGLDTRPLKLTSARPTNTYFLIKTSKGLKTYTLTTKENVELYSAFNEDQSGINVYNTLQGQDSIQIKFKATDSIQNSIDTTMYLKFAQRLATPEQFTSTPKNLALIGPKTLLKGQISFNKPLQFINFDSIYYQFDSTRIIPIKPEDVQYDTLHNTLAFEKSFDKSFLTKPKPIISPDSVKPITQSTDNPKSKTIPNKPIENELIIASGSFISVEADTSKRLTQNMLPTTLENTGVIIVHVVTKEPSFIVELLSRDNKVIVSSKNTLKTTFEDLQPGTYQIRLIIDRDNDGVWSNGNFFKKQEPDPVFFYRNEKKELIVNLKANWELGPLLITY